MGYCLLCAGIISKEERRKVRTGWVFSVFLSATFLAITCCLSVNADENQSRLSYEPLGPLPGLKAPDAAQVDLGRQLFFDPRIAGDATFSCAKCHDPKKAFSDGQPLSEGYPGSLYFRRSLSIINAAYHKRLYWDGRLDGKDMPTLVRDHISEAHFMNADGRLVIERIRQVPEYEEGFKKAFKGEPSYGRILSAISAYVMTIESRNVPFDRFIMDDKSAISSEAVSGYKLFTGKAACIRCHNGSLFSDDEFYNLDIPTNPDIFKEPKRHITFRRFFRTLGVEGYENLRHDPGLYVVTKREEDRGKFRTPSLREVAGRPPYMHNGAFRTIEEVIEFYDRGSSNAANKDKLLKPLGLTSTEKKQLLEFLRSLSGDEISVEPIKLPPYKIRKLGKN